MNSAIKILGYLDKISFMLFIWCFAYIAYIKEYVLLSVILLGISWLLVLCFFKHYTNKAIGNITVDIFIIISCLSGIIEQEDYYQLLGVTTILIAFIDLSYIITLNLKKKATC
ncbi:MAG: hypothetical protein RR212_05040 [Bacteroidales bacterium]